MKLQRDRVILIVLDGFGLSQNDNDDSNAFKLAKTPHLDSIFESNSLCQLEASGRAVGLPVGQMGNSEVGHQNLGAGRIVYQDITRIDLAIEKGELGNNPTLNETFQYVNDNGATLHLVGLVSDGGVHSSIDHLEALVTEARKKDVSQLAIHCLMDGRDTPPHAGVEYVRKLKEFCGRTGLGKIATVMGRYYAMDRDNRWERVQRAYNAFVNGEGHRFSDPVEAVQVSYEREITDEFIEPSIIMENGQPVAQIKDGDAVLFFNFRADRAREITRALTETAFSHFPVKVLNLHYVTMTRYQQDFKFPILFPHQELNQILGEVISTAGLKQLRIAETEKYAHVTFFFNGGEEHVFEGEDRILIPSPKVATYDLQPEMSAPEVARRTTEAIASEKYNLIVLNFANPDMVGHTGVLEAAVKAMETVDEGFWQVYRAALAHDYAVILTSDHGNCEMMIDPKDGGPHTAHTTNPVACFVLDKHHRIKLKPHAALCDIAPTILSILNLEIPPEMEGESIIQSVDCAV